MNGLTRVFLVLLRLAIGWHFLFEGVEKIHSVYLGPTETNRPWTSEGYLREATGPLVGHFREQFGDPDDSALERLTLLPIPPGADPKRAVAVTRLSPALAHDWQTFFDRFVAHHQLTGEQLQRAHSELEQSKENAVKWLAGAQGPEEVKKTFPTGTVQSKETPPRRIEYYRAKLEQFRDLEGREMPTFERDVAKSRWRPLKSEVTRLRTELLADLNRPMHESLRSILTDEQKKVALSETVTPHWWSWTMQTWLRAFVAWGLIVAGSWMLLNYLGQLALAHTRGSSRLRGLEWPLLVVLSLIVAAGLSGFLAWIARLLPTMNWSGRATWLRHWLLAAVAGFLLMSILTQTVCSAKRCAEWSWRRWFTGWTLALLGGGGAIVVATLVAWDWSDWTRQELIDWLVAFGLCSVGACLLLGFLTRPACLGGAVLLLMFYLAMPPVPGVPDNPRAEGHYLYINKNIIEMLALLTLATTASGRWLGLDGLLPLLNPVRWFVRSATDGKTSNRSAPTRRDHAYGH